MRLPWWPRTLLGVTACVVFGVGISQLVEYRVLRFRDRLFPSRSRPLESATLRKHPREQPASLPVLTVAALGRAMGDQDLATRRAVVRALAETGNDATVPFLLRAIKDSDAEIRKTAAEALGDRKEN